MNRALLMTLAVVAGLVVLGALSFGGIYNSLVAAEEGVTGAWAQVENVYQRRLDLIPNLVETVKGYAAHERETLEAVIGARSKITQTQITVKAFNDPQALTQFEQLQQGLTSTLSRLLAIAEQYPDLKANQNFLALQSQLEGTENRIAVERRRFNEVAREFNTRLRIFPNNWVGRLMGFQRKSYFAADEGARTVPEVKF
ncbi:MAG: LemA family protein [Candidatus Omnitrophica bacterium]|nr:LemA family protein [Candidatus Omnitrophota bacterium]